MPRTIARAPRLAPVALTTLIALGTTAGCNKVIWGTSSTTAPPADRAVAAPAPRPAETIVATGDLRDALLNLQRVHFAYNAAELTLDARRALTAAADILAKHPDVQLHVDGHCDARGSAAHNLKLGQRRAETVARFLAGRGVKADRLQATSFGKDQLLAQGLGARDHATNRRVEYRLLKGRAQVVLEQGTLVDDFGRPIVTATATRPTKLAPAAPVRRHTER